GVMVFLKVSLALHGFVDGLEGIDLFGREDKLGWQLLAAVAGLNKLNDGAGGFSGDRHKLDEAFGGFQLTVLDAQTLALHRPEELLDDPAQLVPGDDFPSVGDTFNRMRGQEPPMDGRGAFRGMPLDDFDEVDFH